VHRIGARAERKVTDELVNAFKRVSGKENILFRVAEASLAAPDGMVRQVVFPAVADALLAVAVLIGLTLNAVLGWWWVDPASGLVIVYYAVKEARSIFSNP